MTDPRAPTPVAYRRIPVGYVLAPLKLQAQRFSTGDAGAPIDIVWGGPETWFTGAANAIGWIGELHPRWQQQYELPAATAVFEIDWTALAGRELPSAAEVSKFPPVRRDLAFVVDRAVPAQALVDSVMADRPMFVEGFEVFDSYAGPGVEGGKKALLSGCYCKILERRSPTVKSTPASLDWWKSLRPGTMEDSANNDLPAENGPDERKTLTKAELSEMLFERVGLNKREAKDMVESFFEEVRTALQKGEGVKLSGFGNFHLRDKPQRPGRNPKTGEEIPITARRVVTFHASQKLKAMVDQACDGGRQPS